MVTSEVLCDLVQVLSVVGILQDEADPMVSVMKVCSMSYACLSFEFCMCVAQLCVHVQGANCDIV